MSLDRKSRTYIEQTDILADGTPFNGSAISQISGITVNQTALLSNQTALDLKVISLGTNQTATYNQNVTLTNNQSKYWYSEVTNMSGLFLEVTSLDANTSAIYTKVVSVPTNQSALYLNTVSLSTNQTAIHLSTVSTNSNLSSVYAINATIQYNTSNLHNTNAHLTYLFPDRTDDYVEFVAAGTANTFGNWTNISSANGSWFWERNNDTGIYISALEIEDVGSNNQRYIVEISYGDSNTLVSRHRFSSATLGFLQTHHQTRVRGDKIPANTTIYYRAMCSEANGSAFGYFRYYYET